MARMKQRVEALEANRPTEISAAAKQWLGLPVSDAERLEPPSAINWSNIDTAQMSQEVREWLGLD